MYLAQFEGWTTAYLAMSSLMVLPIVATLLSREPEVPVSTVTRLSLIHI